MIKLEEYLKDEDDIQFVKDIRDATGEDSQCEVFIRYKNLPLLLEPHGAEINVYTHSVLLGSFETFDKMLLNFKLDGKAFIDCIPDVEYDD